ncbi:ATP-binding protein [Reichenbachiella sp. MALMAid0571]|uniref:ATP-binding protein n=1 Tax=Reichenbachiella sp. MALMAid0571 TaxID=3143939 RepID=UPI0032DF0E7A
MVKSVDTKIGKDVIESLTLGMYEDSRFIFREYIQNSADQIDKALEDGIFSDLGDGKIEIDIDATARTISIFDNATGIESNKVQEILKNIAQSTKDRTKNKGFRGIGRLGGLAYCDKLIFETSFKGEETKSILTWDSQKLKAIINNRATKEEATAVIDDVTEFQTEKESGDSHYFRVTLKGVSNNALLDREDVYQYLTMVAPVPYSKGFIFKKKICDKAEELNFNIDEYAISVNNDQVFKAYTTSIYEGDHGNKKKIDEIHDIEFFEIRTSKNKLLAWGWHSISNFTKVIPSVNTARSLRLRKGNIQIGLDEALTKLFKEARGTKYFFGEIHTISSELIPNARRDYFLENSDLVEFERLVKSKFDELHKLYYFSSKIRNEVKKIDDFKTFANEYNEKSTTGGFTDNKEQKEYREKFELKREKAQLATKELEKAQEKASTSSPSHQKVYEKVIGHDEPEIEHIVIANDNGKPKYITDDITSLSRKDRKLVSQIYAVIDNVLPKDIANILKEKIKEDLSK